MDQRSLIEQVRDYFVTSDHWRRLVSLLQDPEPRKAHVHAYVYTTIHPDSLETIIRRYFASRGWPIVRRINRIRPKPGIKALHGIEPQDRVHWDLHWLYKQDVGLAPAHGVENDNNLLSWNRCYIDDFYSRFSFREVGPAEEDALRAYFASNHFEHGLDIAARQNVPHVHINVETSIHPDIIGRFALKALDRRGWSVYYLCPNVYLLDDQYVGKVVCMGRDPEKVYDIGWQFNPDVVIRSATSTWLFPDRIGYDVMTTEQFEQELAQDEYITLTDDEIDAVIPA